MTNNKIIKHSDLLIIISWVCFPLQVISLYLIHDYPTDTLLSGSLQFFLGLLLPFITIYYLSSRDSAFVVRYSNMTLPLLLVFLIVEPNVNIQNLISEYLLLISSVAFFKRRSLRFFSEKANHFLSSILFSISIVLNPLMIFFAFFFVLISVSQNQQPLKELTLFGISCFVSLFIYYGVYFLLDLPIDIWHFSSESILSLDSIDSQIYLCVVALIVLLLNLKQFKPFPLFFQYNAYLLVGVILWQFITGSVLHLLPTALICFLTPFTYNNYPKLVIPLYIGTLVAGWWMVVYPLLIA